MKSILQDIITNDTSYNRSATKMLKKTHPELWADILNATAFLPNTAKPKQRVWHVLHDTYEIPLCPETGMEVKWHENRYLTYSSLQASRKDVAKKLSEVITGVNHWRSKDPIKSKKANDKYSQGMKNGRYTSMAERQKDRDYDEVKKKTINTWIKKYGVDNPSKDKAVQEKIYQQAVKRGCTPREERSLRRSYYDAVWKITEESWRNHFDSINPTRLNRTFNALDHIYSIQQGFLDCIPPYIIGHWTNLRIISLSENGIKGMRCDKTKEELFEDFELAI
jgi:hypothetical protein